MKRIVLTCLLLAPAIEAQAGFWDFLFGSNDSESEAVAETPATSDTSTTQELLQQSLALIPMLTQTLGVSQIQAESGIGALLSAAQSLLSGGDFTTLAAAIPNAEQLLALAPTLEEKPAGGTTNLLNSALDAAAEHSTTAQTASTLLGQFKQLGLSADMIPKFTQTTEQYLEQTDASQAADLLSSSLGSLF